jgi:hypothetical protein
VLQFSLLFYQGVNVWFEYRRKSLWKLAGRQVCYK